jgi:4-carboxymuconolactone decarboxylase
MKNLDKKEKELVALGTALGSNCIPCVVYHISEARKNGISDEQIREAIDIAEKVKKVPAQNVLNSAYAQIDPASEMPRKNDSTIPPDCCT